MLIFARSGLIKKNMDFNFIDLYIYIADSTIVNDKFSFDLFINLKDKYPILYDIFLLTIIPISQYIFKHLRIYYHLKKSSRFKYDAAKLALDNLYMINKWSQNRPLERSKHNVIYRKVGNKYKLLDRFSLREEYVGLVNKYKQRNLSGKICYLVDYSIDFCEDKTNEDFNIYVTDGDYAEYLAVLELMNKHLILNTEIKNLLTKNPRAYINNFLPSNITVNTVILSAANNFLAIQRSMGTATAKGKWTVGACETMVMPSFRPGEDNSLFNLVECCMNEELGEQSKDNYRYFISWIGIYGNRTHVVAIVKPKEINEDKIIKQSENAKSNHEAQAYEWLPLKSKNIKNYIETRETFLYDREWLDFSRLSLYEAHRVKDFI